jgi:hypothetical protein
VFPPVHNGWDVVVNILIGVLYLVPVAFLLFAILMAVDMCLDYRMSDWFIEKRQERKRKKLNNKKTTFIDYTNLSQIYAYGSPSGNLTFKLMSNGGIIDNPFAPKVMPTIDDVSATHVETVDFEGTDFAVGQLRGTRSFKIDDYGRLTGVYYTQVWKPGVNEAECHAVNSSVFPVLDDLWRYRTNLDVKLSTYLKERLQHGTLGKMGHKLNGTPVRALPDNEPPEVKNDTFVYGEPGDPEYDCIAAEMDECQRRIKVVKDKANEFLGTDHSIDACSHGFYGYYEGSNDYYRDGMVMGVVEAFGEVVIGSRGFKSTKAKLLALYIPDSVDYKKAALVKRNYKDVAFFPSFNAMMLEFPPDVNTVEEPDPSNDEDFWDMP